LRLQLAGAGANDEQIVLVGLVLSVPRYPSDSLDLPVILYMDDYEWWGWITQAFFFEKIIIVMTWQMGLINV